MKETLKLPPNTIYVTGISASGKSTMAKLYKEKYPDTYVIDEFYLPTQKTLDAWISSHPTERVVFVSEKL